MNYKAFFLGAAGVFIALIISLSILTGAGNILGQLYFYSLLCASVFGLLTPRSAIFVLIPITAFLDLFKRLMVVASNPSPMDVAYIQAVPMGLLAGAMLGLIGSMAFGRISIRKGDLMLLFSTIMVAAVLVGGVVASEAAAGRLGLRSLGLAANQGFYACLLFLIPMLLRTTEERRKLLKFIYWMFVPVALYTFRHRFFGLADFEHDYLLTGLTAEARILWEQEALRSFSTMSGAAVVSVMMSICAAGTFPFPGRDGKPLNFFGLAWRIPLFVLFVFAAYFTISRGGWVCGIAAIATYIGLASYRRTMVFGACAVAAIIGLIIAAPNISESGVLRDIEASMMSDLSQDDAYAKRAVVLGTMNARLEGWSNLTQRPEVWTPFGFAAADRSLDFAKYEYGHDMIIDSLIRVGYVPLFSIMILFAWMLHRLVKFQFTLRKGHLPFSMSRWSLAMSVGILFGGLGNIAQLRSFPLNTYFFLFLSFCVAEYFESRRLRAVARTRPVMHVTDRSAPLEASTALARSQG